jgi:DNA polymerase-3 subunit gamma/tau
MENFIVSARKYRPQTFDSVVGQQSITNTLKNAILNNHLAQAFLFCGPRGVGKTTCARIFAKTINCENISPEGEACDKCESCISFNGSVSFNIHELDAASNNSVDDIRNLVDQVRIPPQVGKYKVYIIDEVHMLSQAAFNAFLKTLEEPPAYAKFILATTEKHKIIPTILSRCQIYDFKRITVEDIASHLVYVAEQEGITAESDALHIIAQKADGALRDALSIFDQIVSFGGKHITYKKVIESLNVLDYDYYFRITDSVINGNVRDTLLIINEIIDNGFDGQHFIIGFGEHLRNLLVCKDEITIKLLEVGEKIKNRYIKQARICSVNFLIKALDLNTKCDINYKVSNNKKLLVELALMQMCSLSTTPQEQKSEPVLPAAKKQNAQYNPPQPKPSNVVNEPASKPVAKKKPVSSATIPGTISISKPAVEEKANQESPEDLSKKPADEFTAERFENVWSSYVGSVERDKNFYATLSKHKPEINSNVILLTVDNKVQADVIRDRKAEILGFIREKLNNYQIQIETRVTEITSKDKPYTSQDKYNKMVEKNPVLKNLKDQLSLEIDY